MDICHFLIKVKFKVTELSGSCTKFTENDFPWLVSQQGLAVLKFKLTNVNETFKISGYISENTSCKKFTFDRGISLALVV